MDKAGLVFLPLPGLSHLVPMIDFAKRLLQLHPDRFTITVLNIPPFPPSTSTSPQISSYVSSVAASGLPVSFHDLPPLDPSAIQNKVRANFFGDLLDLYAPHVKSAIKAIDASSSSAPPVVAVIVDLFLSRMIDVGAELGIATYIFFTCSAAMLGLMFRLQDIAALIPDEEKTMEKMQGRTIELPGWSTPFPLLALPEGLIDLKGDTFTWFAANGRRYLEAKGIVVNTFFELEEPVVKALADDLYVPDRQTPPVYPVGPVISVGPAESAEAEKHECIRWLDEQPQGSVVFLCFGSMGSIPTPQAREIAAGLERSGHRFLWVLRSPGPPDGATGRTRPVEAVLDEVLPDGFLCRTKDRGMVWPSFAPQKAILAHEATGGFVTHCGWNSSLEGLWFGVPMVAWPLYAEQHMNAHELTKEIGVAVELSIDRCKGNVATAEEVERAVKCLMGEEGREVRKKVREMSDIGRKALQEGGSSFDYLQRLARDMVEGATVPFGERYGGS